METKFLITFGLVFLTAGIASYGYANESDSINIMDEFKQWKVTNNKYYSKLEDTYRFKIFSENLKIVKEHNSSKQHTFTMATNKFAALTNEEFTQQYLSLKTISENHQVKSSSGESIPDVWEWNKKLTIKVKDQGSCGSCWAFSGVGALEVAFAIAGKLVSLSDQELVDCTNQAGFESDGCNGGWMNDAFSYSEQFGIADEIVYPYKGAGGVCDKTKTPRYYSKSHILVEQYNAQALKEAIAQTAVSVAINASGIWFQLYSAGIFGRYCAGYEELLNHAVLATGYDNNQMFYNIKNSWGQDWGDDGYIKFAYVDAPEGQCGLQQMPSYPIV